MGAPLKLLEGPPWCFLRHFFRVDRLGCLFRRPKEEIFPSCSLLACLDEVHIFSLSFFFFVVKCRYCLNVSSFSPLPFGAETSNISLLYFGFCPCLFYYFQVPTLFRSASMIGNGKNAWETHAMPHLGFRGLWTAYCIHCWSLLACLIYKHLGLFFYLEY